MKTLSFFFPTPIPMSRPRASSHQAQTSWSAELPVPVPCTHFFYALNMIMAGYVGIPCLQQTLQNKGDHQQLQQLAHNNKTFQVRERSRFQSSESGPKHEAGRLARIILKFYVTCKQAVLNIMLSGLWETAFGNIVMKVWIYARSPVVKLMI